jgi:hypothetical protein
MGSKTELPGGALSSGSLQFVVRAIRRFAPIKMVVDEIHGWHLYASYRSSTETLLAEAALCNSAGINLVLMSATLEMQHLGPELDSRFGVGNWTLILTPLVRPNLKRVVAFLPDDAVRAGDWLETFARFVEERWYPLVGEDAVEAGVILITTHTVAHAEWVYDQINGTNTKAGDYVGKVTAYSRVLGSAVIYHGKLTSAVRAEAVRKLGTVDPAAKAICARLGRPPPRTAVFKTMVATASAVDTGLNDKRIYITCQGQNVPSNVCVGDQLDGRGGRADQPSLAYRVCAPKYLGSMAYMLRYESYDAIQGLLMSLFTYTSDTSCLRSLVYNALCPPNQWGGRRDILLKDRRKLVQQTGGSACCCHNCDHHIRAVLGDVCIGVMYQSAAATLLSEMTKSSIPANSSLKLAPPGKLSPGSPPVFTYSSAYAAWVKIVKVNPDCKRAGCQDAGSTVAGRGFVLLLLEGLLTLNVWETPRYDEPEKTTARMGVGPAPCLAAEKVRQGRDGLFKTWGVLPTSNKDAC